MAHQLNKIVLVVTAIALISSCSTQKVQDEKNRIFPEYHFALDSIIKDSIGIIHGAELGFKLNDIKSKQFKKPDELDVDYLLYNFSVDSITNYDIVYNFVADTLSEIEARIQCKSIDEAGKILESLKNYYRVKYTAPLMDKGVYVFNCFDSRKRNFSISLTDNSTAETGIINLLVYREE